MQFPLPLPDETSCAALEKSWSRVDLERYVQRWERSTIPDLPDELLGYSWRGLDIGCGFGRYLLSESERHPERGYLGIDKGSLRGGTMVKRFDQAVRANLFGMHANVTPVLERLAPELFDEITIFYPNPWWPPRHRKKRWSYHPLLPKLVELLKPGGRILLTSNEAFYLAEWAYTLGHHPVLREQLELVYAGPIEVAEGRTHFEVKFMAEGIPCGEIRAQKR